MSPRVRKYPQAGLCAKQERHMLDSLMKQSQTFIPNTGQMPNPVHFYTHGAGYSFYFTPGTVNMAFIERLEKQTSLDRHYQHFPRDKARPEVKQARQGIALSLRFIGSNPSASIKACKEEPGTVNYFMGSDPTKWRTSLHSYAEIVYPELWPGIDMVFRNTGDVLKYEFIIQPGADLNKIRLTYDGVDNISPDADGNLLLHTPKGILTEQRPVSYQSKDEQQLPIAAEFTLERQPDGTFIFGFTVGADYDPHSPLVIDPGLVYSTYLGSSTNTSIAVDTSGSAYVTGFVGSPDFPAFPGAFQTSLEGSFAAFVAKLNPAGNALVYSTYLGGSGLDEGLGIAVDSSGNAYITGWTTSPDFPTTPDAFQTSRKSFMMDAFITKLNPTGSALVYSTYLGGAFTFDQQCNGIAVDASGNAYVTGFTGAKDFPITPGAFQSISHGGFEAFITKLNPAGSALVYSTFLGGSVITNGNGIAVDTSGSVYVTGGTNSPDFPITPGAFQTTSHGRFEVFVTKLNPAGTALIYSTYLGGNHDDTGRGIAVDPFGNAYVTGITDSVDFPTTLGAFQTTSKGGGNTFVTKLNLAGSALIYSTYLGGSGIFDEGRGIAVDTSGNAYVTGDTRSTDFPTSPDAFQTTLKGEESAFFTKITPNGSALAYSTYLGGNFLNTGLGIAIDTFSNTYLTGLNQSTDFPITLGAFLTLPNGAFVTKLQTSPNESLQFLRF